MALVLIIKLWLKSIMEFAQKSLIVHMPLFYAQIRQLEFVDEIISIFSDMHRQHNCGEAGSMSWGEARRIVMSLDWSTGV